ncbi:MAG: polyketide synthase dehydratase domain-containing protein, partial [Actinomycetota bacterium]|nr:polyketide synthase dehydratase domain-containing protein [Actinomycetota bacterium]
MSTVGECEEFGTVAYWVRQVREPVRFADAVERADAARILEVGPDGSLTAGYDGIAMNPLPAGLSRAWVAGVDVDWAALLPGGRLTDAPTYPFEHRTYWPPARPGADATGLGLEPAGHPLLAARLTAPDGAVTFTGRWSVATHPWLGDHVIGGRTVVPGAVLAGLALHAAGPGAHVRDLTITIPLELDITRSVQVTVDPGRAVTIHSRPADGDEPWTVHASGTLAEGTTPPVGLGAWPPAGAEQVDVTGCYDDFAAHGFAYGPAFQGLRAVWRDGADTYAEIALPPEATGEYDIHPVLLDAALHATILTADGGAARVPFAWQGVHLTGIGATALRVRITRADSGTLTITAADQDGTPVLGVESLTVRQLPTTEVVHAVGWVPVPANAGEGQTFVTAPGVELRSAVGAALARMQEHLA